MACRATRRISHGDVTSGRFRATLDFAPQEMPRPSHRAAVGVEQPVHAERLYAGIDQFRADDEIVRRRSLCQREKCCISSDGRVSASAKGMADFERTIAISKRNGLKSRYTGQQIQLLDPRSQSFEATT